MLWHRRAIFESKGDKLSSSAECRIRTHQGLRHQIASRLNARWQTDWAIEDQAKNLNSTARPYDQRAFSPLDPIAVWHSHLALAIYMFVVVNFDALAQASDIRIERRQVVFLCWMQDSNPSGSQTPNRQQTECPLTNRLSYRGSSYNIRQWTGSWLVQIKGGSSPIICKISVGLPMVQWVRVSRRRYVMENRFYIYWIETLPPHKRPVTRCFDVFLDITLNGGWTNREVVNDLIRYADHVTPLQCQTTSHVNPTSDSGLKVCSDSQNSGSTLPKNMMWYCHLDVVLILEKKKVLILEEVLIILEEVMLILEEVLFILEEVRCSTRLFHAPLRATPVVKLFGPWNEVVQHQYGMIKSTTQNHVLSCSTWRIYESPGERKNQALCMIKLCKTMKSPQIRSSDNDSTSFWPPGSLHTLGADGHI